MAFLNYLSAWEQRQLQHSDSIPMGSDADIGRKMLNKTALGWAAVGAVVGYKGVTEARTQPGPAVEGEIGDTTVNLHGANCGEKWIVQFGNGAVVEVGITDLIYGMQLFHKAQTSIELRDTYAITENMLHEIPPIVQADSKDPPSSKRVGRKPAAAVSSDAVISFSDHCPVCNKVFKSAAGLKYHRLNVCVPEEILAERNKKIANDIDIGQYGSEIAENIGIRSSKRLVKLAETKRKAIEILSDVENSDESDVELDSTSSVCSSERFYTKSSRRKHSNSSTSIQKSKTSRQMSAIASGRDRIGYQLHRSKWLNEPLYEWATSFRFAQAYFTDSEIGKFAIDHSMLDICTFAEHFRRMTLPSPFVLPVAVTDNHGQVTHVPPFEGKPRFVTGLETMSTDGPSKRFHRAGTPACDIFLNCCGPIWDCAFSPNRFSNDTYFLAVATSRVGWVHPSEETRSIGGCGLGSDLPFVLGQRYFHNNLLQVWEITSSAKDENIEVVSNDRKTVYSNTQSSKATLKYFIGFPRRGSSWRLAWCPPSACPHSSGLGTIFLGILAVVCGDGTCLVLVLPNSVSSEIESSMDYSETNVISENSVCRWILDMEDNSIISATWNPHAKLELLCGMRDGTITVWRLDPAALPSPEDRPPLTLRVPIKQFVDSSVDKTTSSVSAVSSLKYCPYHPQLFVSGGYDGSVKVWNIDDCFRPRYMRRPLLGWIYDVEWDPCGVGLLLCGSDTSSVVWDPLWSKLPSKRASLFSHSDKNGACWKVKSCILDGQSATFSASSDGGIRCGINSQLLFAKPKPQILELMGVQSIETAPTNDQSTNSSGVQLMDIVHISTIRRVDASDSTGLPCTTAGISLHALDIFMVSDIEAMTAYGGASGIIRVERRLIGADFLL